MSCMSYAGIQGLREGLVLALREEYRGAVRRWILLPAAAAVLSLGAGCETTRPDPGAENAYRGATFEIPLPSGVTAAADQGDGYAVHYFRIGASKCQMGIYEGQKPRLFSSKEKDLTVMRRGKVSRAEAPQGDDVWGVDSHGKIWRESVWRCLRRVTSDQGKRFEIPTFLHIWYFGASEEEQQAFDALIADLRMRR